MEDVTDSAGTILDHISIHWNFTSRIHCECCFGAMKLRIPILRNLRLHLELSKIIVTTAVLGNMAQAWGEPDPDDVRVEEDQDDSGGPDYVVMMLYSVQWESLNVCFN